MIIVSVFAGFPDIDFRLTAVHCTVIRFISLLKMGAYQLIHSIAHIEK